MPPAEFRRAAESVTGWITRYLEDPRRYPVVPSAHPGELRASLPAQAPDHAEPIDRILADFESLIVPACTLWNHPRFFSYFAVSSSGPGILAEYLTAALNMNGMLWRSSPAVTELEQVTLDWLRQWMGLPDGFFGILHDTASVSTMHAILAARQWADPETRTRGAVPGFVLYTSSHAHSSVEKGALALGIGKDNVRLIAVDSEFRMSVPDLEQAIASDRAAGRRPFCVVATVGTTSTTAIDPVPAVAAVCERERLWLHVDAAYGGPLAILPEYQHYLEGASRADSLVTNPHKWLFTPIDASAFYTRHPDALREALSLVPAYLQSSESGAVNYMDYSVSLGRRFRALKLWFVMRYFGREGIVERIRAHIAMTQLLRDQIAADSRFEICAPSPMGLVCFRLRGADELTRALVDRLHASGEAFLSLSMLNGRAVVRWSIGNIHTQQADIDATWNRLKAIADGLV